jgi:hypothetical protein
VGIPVPLDDAVLAAETTIETLIGYLEERIDGTAGRFIANRRTKETHSYLRPCSWVSQMAHQNRWVVDDKPPTYKWCDWCFPDRRDG